jgi:Domain of unknown function (DUF4148)
VRLIKESPTADVMPLQPRMSDESLSFEIDMNARKLVAVAALSAAALPAFADQLYPYVDIDHFQGAKPRAEVTQELKAGQANGTYVVGDHEYVEPAANFASSKSRAQAMAELKQSKADGSYALMHEEYEGQVPVQGGSGDAGPRLAHRDAASDIK